MKGLERWRYPIHLSESGLLISQQNAFQIVFTPFNNKPQKLKVELLKLNWQFFFKVDLLWYKCGHSWMTFFSLHQLALVLNLFVGKPKDLSVSSSSLLIESEMRLKKSCKVQTYWTRKVTERCKFYRFLSLFQVKICVNKNIIWNWSRFLNYKATYILPFAWSSQLKRE